MFPSQLLRSEINHLVKLAAKYRSSNFAKYFKELNILDDQLRRDPAITRLDEIWDELVELEIAHEPHSNS